MWMRGLLKAAGVWLRIPAVILITGIYAVLKAIGILKKKKCAQQACLKTGEKQRDRC